MYNNSRGGADAELLRNAWGKRKQAGIADKIVINIEFCEVLIGRSVKPRFNDFNRRLKLYIRNSVLYSRYSRFHKTVLTIFSLYSRSSLAFSIT